MSRIIKFRAWNGLNMLDNFLVARPQFADPLKIMTDEQFALSQYGQKEWKVMQFTGLLDKHGVEIYEGDLVKDSEETYIIEFGAYSDFEGIDHIGFYCKQGDKSFGLSPEDGQVFEIIGNVHQLLR